MNEPRDPSSSTRQRIREIADTLLSEGRIEEVTHARMRELLGGGSYGTISSELKAWWKDVGKRASRNLEVGDAPPAVGRAFAELWSSAVDVARRRHHEQVEGFKARIEESERLRTERSREAEAARAEAETVRQENTTLAAQVAQLQAQLQEVSTRLAESLAHLTDAREAAHLARAQADRARQHFETQAERIEQEGARRQRAHELELKRLREERTAAEAQFAIDRNAWAAADRASAARVAELEARAVTDSASLQEAKRALKATEAEVITLSRSLANARDDKVRAEAVSEQHEKRLIKLESMALIGRLAIERVSEVMAILAQPRGEDETVQLTAFQAQMLVDLDEALRELR